MTTLALSPTFPRVRMKRRSRAFGLLEVILVFAIVIGAAAVTFTVFTSSNASAEAATQSEAINVVVANIRALNPNHDFTQLAQSANTAPKAFFPASMIGADGAPRMPWSPIWIGAYFKNHQQFDINFNYLPDDGAECAKFVAAMGTVGLDDIRVAGSGPEDIGDSVYTNGKLDMAKLNSWCSGLDTSGPSVGVDLIGH